VLLPSYKDFQRSTWSSATQDGAATPQQSGWFGDTPGGTLNHLLSSYRAPTSAAPHAKPHPRPAAPACKLEKKAKCTHVKKGKKRVSRCKTVTVKVCAAKLKPHAKPHARPHAKPHAKPHRKPHRKPAKKG